ncbi:MAG: orotidine-5'-phosphate decarboxylase [Planctomycetota bacterium]
MPNPEASSFGVSDSETPIEPFAERILARIRRLETSLIVGIDPVIQRFPAELQSLDAEEALLEFSRAVIDAVRNDVAAVKPQVAFFERFGWRGWRALQGCVEHAAKAGVPVILDAKRGDIGSTATAYADALLGDRPETPGPYVDALTVNPYLGEDSLEPFLERAVAGGRGLFILARTSNPGAGDFQDRRSADEPLYLGVARAVTRWSRPYVSASGYGPLGLVSGATYPEELAQIRAAAPHSFLLVPGLGAQGGKAEDLKAAFDQDGVGALPSSSRGVIYAYSQRPEVPWQEAIAEAARATRLSLA